MIRMIRMILAFFTLYARRPLLRPLLVGLMVVVALLATGDTVTGAIDVATLVSLIWGIVSIFLLKAIPAKDGSMVLISYAAPIIVVALAVLIVDGTSGFTLQKFAVDVLIAYGANQALFQAAKHTVPVAVE